LNQSGLELSSWPDPADWIEEHFYIPELKGPIQLEPYQRDALREALRRDDEGNFVYSTVIWSDVKKSAKSTICAAMVLYFALHTTWGEIYMIANDLKQADSRVAKYFRRALDLNPEFKKAWSQRGYMMTMKETRTTVEAIPIDPSGEAGSNADLIQFSELWGAHESAKQKMFAEMTLSPTKHGQSLRWIESYAGYTDESELLYSLYDRGINNGEHVWPDRLYHSNLGEPSVLNLKSEGRMLCLWNQEPRCPWQTKEYYDEEEKLLLPSEFQRMHRNQWVTSVETFVPIEWWDDCKEEIPEYDPKTPMIVSMDAGVSNDPFGMVMVCRDPNDNENVVLKYSKRWLPPKGGKLNFQGTPENRGPELELLWLIENYNVVMVAYDPYQLEDMAGRIRRLRLTWMKDFDQGTRRLKSDSMLRNKIRGKTIIHNGEHEHVRQNILNANAKIQAEELEDRKIRIVKKTKDKKVDLTVALAMAVYECMRLNL
jgi:phage terminase large subunit-like protein